MRARRYGRIVVISSQGVYSPNDDSFHAYSENDPIGRGATMALNGSWGKP